MTDQPKLKGTPEPWHHVAREFGDHDMDTDGGWNPITTMEPVGDAYYIGDWLPVEPVCKEVVALRAKLDAATRERDFLVSEYERAVKCEPQGFTHAAAHIYNAIVNAKCDASAEHFMRLLSKLDAIHRYVADRADEDDGRLNGEAVIWQEFFDGKEPDA